MADFKIKFKVIFLPYLYILIGVLFFYTLITYLIRYVWNLNIKDEWLCFIFPIILVSCSIIFVLREKIHLLYFKKDWHTFYYFTIGLFILIPAIILQEYQKDSQLKLKHVQHVSDITPDPNCCYRIDNFQTIKTVGSFYTTSPRRNHTSLIQYVTIAIVDNTENYSNSKYNYWYGFRNSTNISAFKSEEKLKQTWDKLYKETIEKLNAKDFNDYQYLRVLPKSYEYDSYLNAIKSVQINIDESKLVILVPEKNPYNQRNNTKLKWFWSILALGILTVYFMIEIPPLDNLKYQKYKNHNLKINLFEKGFIDFLSFKSAKIIPLLFYINIIVYVYIVIMGVKPISGFETNAYLYKYGAINSSVIDQGEYWRFITSMFLHDGLFHLWMFMFALCFAGYFVEIVMGAKRTCIIYFISGILATTFSLLIHTTQFQFGSNGAVMGLMGSILVIMITNIDAKNSFMHLILILILIPTILLGFFIRINNTANISGFIVGALITYLMIEGYDDLKSKLPTKKKTKKKNN
ncbi:MAG: rhomboid family intramembrane serine protease [Bacteroidales bacterium]|nr:rhomboid family intramembrane serine protease [Bacteroidales bacterium]